MNIFILDKDPVVAAQMLCDKHVPKMLVESGQMLSTVHRLLDGTPTKKRSKSGKTMQTYYEFGDERDELYYLAYVLGHPGVDVDRYPEAPEHLEVVARVGVDYLAPVLALVARPPYNLVVDVCYVLDVYDRVAAELQVALDSHEAITLHDVGDV